jgi:hypothetical protein
VRRPCLLTINPSQSNTIDTGWFCLRAGIIGALFAVLVGARYAQISIGFNSLSLGKIVVKLTGSYE